MIRKLSIPIVKIIPGLIFLLAFSACTPSGDTDIRRFTIGLITNSNNGLRNVAGFKAGMADLGYREGENVDYVYSESPVSNDFLDTTLLAMVEEGVDLIFTAGTPTGIAAHRVTAERDIPVVFGVIADPIEAGVLTNLSQPGGNMTGVMLAENQGRRLEYLLEIAPNSQSVLVPYDHEDAASVSALYQLRDVADNIGIELVELKCDCDNDNILGSFPSAEAIDAIFLVPGTRVNAHLNEINAYAFQLNLPVSAPSTIQVEEGALTTYGFIHYEAGSQASHIAVQILNGTDAGEIPVEIAESYLAINLDTAEAIGLEIPYDILLQASLIIQGTN